MLRARVFISYRRIEARAFADACAAHLRRVLPYENVFYDTSSLVPGMPFPPQLKHAVEHADICLVVMGRDWAQLRDLETGELRLTNPLDFVRIEVATALRQGIPVVPVLLGAGTVMPSADMLPEDIADLSSRHAIFADANNPLGAIEEIVRAHRLGVLTLADIVGVASAFHDIALCDRSISDAKRRTLASRTTLRAYEDIAALVDLTWSENARDFLLFTTAGLHHRSAESDADTVFIPHSKLGATALSQPDARTILSDPKRMDVSGTDGPRAFALTKAISALAA